MTGFQRPSSSAGGEFSEEKMKYPCVNVDTAAWTGKWKGRKQRRNSRRRFMGFCRVQGEGIGREEDHATMTSRKMRLLSFPRAGWNGGADERSRTPDLLITNQLLYQLSYIST